MKKIAMATCVALFSVALIAPLVSAEDDARKSITWAEDVAPIMQENCQGCHRPGQIAPFSMLDFEEIRPWAKSIKEQVSRRTMPPYFAHPDSLPTKGDLNLTDEEIDTIVAWVDQGAKRGDLSKLPAPRKFKTFEGGWALRKPDIVLQAPDPFMIPGGADDLYQCFFVPLALDRDIWIKGVEFQPDNTAVVHHFILFEDVAGRFKAFDDATPEPGVECVDMEKVLIGTNIIKMWAPGNVQPLSSEGVGQKVSAGSNLILQVHFHNETGEDQFDQSKFAFHLAQPEETIMKQSLGQLVVQPFLDIKAGDPESRHEARFTTRKDVTITSSGVHMHLRGKSMGMWATRPGETEETTIIWVPNYDFNWQLSYELLEPWKAPVGTTFIMRSVHDNSADNPFNPDPTKDIHWGSYSTDEMAFSGYSYTVDDEALNITPEIPSAEEIARVQAAVGLPPDTK